MQAGCEHGWMKPELRHKWEWMWLDHSWQAKKQVDMQVVLCPVTQRDKVHTVIMKEGNHEGRLRKGLFLPEDLSQVKIFRAYSKQIMGFRDGWGGNDHYLVNGWLQTWGMTERTPFTSFLVDQSIWGLWQLSHSWSSTKGTWGEEISLTWICSWWLPDRKISRGSV